MPRVAILEAEVTLDPSDLIRGLSDADKAVDKSKRKLNELETSFERLDKAGSSLTQVGGMLSIGLTAPLTALAYSSIKTASSLEESYNKVNVVLKEHAGRVHEWTKNSAEGFGQSRAQAEAAVGTFANLFNTMGLTTQKSADMSMSIVQLASDLASFNDIDPAEALHKLQSGLVGEAEALRSVGVLINENLVTQKAYTSGIAKEGEALTDAQKVHARYLLIMEQTAAAQGDFKRTGEGFANSQRKLTAALSDGAAVLGKALLPAALTVVKTVVPGIKMVAGVFQSLPQPIQATVLVVGALTAAIGPLLYVTGQLFSSWVNIREGFKAVREIIPAVTTVLGLKTKAVVDETIATTVNTAEHGRNTVATNVNAASKATSIVPWTGATAAINANTAASAVNQRFLAKAMAPHIGRGAGVLGTAGGAAAAIVGGVAAGYYLNVAKDAREGKSEVNWGQTTGEMGLNPWYRPMRDVSESNQSDMRDFQKARSEGNSPAQRAQAARKQASETIKAEAQKAIDDFRKARDQQFEALLQAAKTSVAGGSEESKSQREAKALIPVLSQRMGTLQREADALKPFIKDNHDKAEEYYKHLKDISSLEEEVVTLKSRSLKEQNDNTKKAKDKALDALKGALDLKNAQLDNYVLQQRAAFAGTMGDDADSDTRSIAEAQVINPALRAKQAALAQMAKQVVEEARKNPEMAKEYESIRSEYLNLELQVNQNTLRAQKAHENILKKQQEQYKADREAYFSSQKERVRSMIEGADEEQKENVAAREMIPILRDQQKQLLADMQKPQKNAEEYYKAVEEYWKKESELQGILSGQRKHALDAQKKAVEDTRKQSKEMNDLASARVRLAEAQLENNPLLSDQGRKRGLLPTLFEQLKQMLRPVQGESELDKTNRMVDAEGVKKKILEGVGASGQGAFSRGLGGLIPRFSTRDLRAALGRISAIEQESSRNPITAARNDALNAANGASGNAPVVYQIVLPDSRPETMRREFDRLYEESVRRTSPSYVPSY